MIQAYVLPLLAKAADNLARGCWWEEFPITDNLQGAWLVGAVYSGNAGHDYAARNAFSGWWAPGEFRADGLRTNETADDRGRRIGRAATVAAMREFIATHSGSVAA